MYIFETSADFHRATMRYIPEYDNYNFVVPIAMSFVLSVSSLYPQCSIFTNVPGRDGNLTLSLDSSVRPIRRTSPSIMERIPVLRTQRKRL
jgi:hypothetical protein